MKAPTRHETRTVAARTARPARNTVSAMGALAPDVELRLPEPEDVDAFLDLVVRNRDHFRPYEPRRPPAYFTLAGQREQIAAARARRLGRDAHSQVGRVRHAGS
jgi:hypothetical protein